MVEECVSDESKKVGRKNVCRIKFVDILRIAPSSSCDPSALHAPDAVAYATIHHIAKRRTALQRTCIGPINHGS